MKALENLKWSPKWVSHLGCVKGCLDYLGLEMSDAWLYGGTGHAFIINISRDSCPSGPTAWKTMMLHQQGPALGYRVQSLFGSKYAQDLADLQKQAWDFTRDAIDRALPVYAWELDIPEFYVVYGYDDVGYYYSGPGTADGAGPKPWGELGDTGIGLVEFYSLEPAEPAPPEELVRTAIQAALKHAANPTDWIFEKYAAGLQGYDNWISGLESGIADRFGMGYNAAVWHECRNFAVDFLGEANNRLEGKASSLFDQAAQQYQVVANCLEAVGWLKGARQAEAAGLSILEKIAAVLD